METKIITKKELGNFVSAIISSGVETYGVQEKNNGKFHYAPLTNAENLRLDYDVTLTPPKQFLTPPVETLVKFQVSPEVKTQAVCDTNKRILIGVHPYDMIAINQMDEVFKETNEDMHYFKRRNNSVIIGVDPQTATSWSFWCMMDAGTVDTGYDIWLTKLDDNTYFVEAKTEAGKELLSKNAKTTDVTEDQKNKRDSIRANLHSVCDTERKMNARAGEIPLLAKDNKDHPTFEERAEKCYSCGSCNLVCPTCYCFDVQDDFEVNMKEGTRVRKWDGCQLEEFAAVGHGENFREKRVDRFKHRFFRKTLYMYEKYNNLACVGCGRCSSVCLPNIADPVDIINSLKEGK